MKSAVFEKIILDRIPENAISYCVSLFEEHPFLFKISKNRKSKSGDYRYDKRSKTSVTTVNAGLNRYSFLITLIHEISHHYTKIRYPNSVKPHGPEWKHEFRNLMLPLLNPLVFPDSLLPLLVCHMKNPKASTWSDGHLSMALRKYDAHLPTPDELHLHELPEGNRFLFNKREFKKLKMRRTRIMCQECSTGRKYLIPGQAVVRAV